MESNIIHVEGNNFSGRSKYLKMSTKKNGIHIGEIPSHFLTGLTGTVEEELNLFIQNAEHLGFIRITITYMNYFVFPHNQEIILWESVKLGVKFRGNLQFGGALDYLNLSLLNGSLKQGITFRTFPYFQNNVPLGETFFI